MVVLTAVALAYVSLLTYIRLSSQGIARRRVVRLLVELWLDFALIISAFVLVSAFVGPVSRGKSVADELAARLARVHVLSAGKQVLIVGLFVLAVLVFVHFIWSLRAIERRR